MDILSWIVLGLVAGLLAKFILPGRDGGGIIVTILIGIAGALIGGFLGRELGFAGGEALNLRGILVATLGAILLLIIFRLVRKK